MIRTLFLLLILSVYAGAATFDTSARYSDGKGHYDAAREALHERIIDKFLAQGKLSKYPELLFTAGGSGAGKSETLKSLEKVNFIVPSDYIMIDADEIKKELPEYPQFTEEDRANASTLVHQESVDIQEQLLKQALESGKNIILDGTLRHKDYWAGFIDDVHRKKPDYHVSIFFVDVPEEVALERARARAKVTGRTVPESFVRESNQKSREAIQVLRKHADSTISISNLDKPIFVSAHGRQGKDIMNLNLPVDVLTNPSKMRKYFQRLEEGNYWRPNWIIPAGVPDPGVDDLFSELKRNNNKKKALMFLGRYPSHLAHPELMLNALLHDPSSAIRISAIEVYCRSILAESPGPAEKALARKLLRGIALHDSDSTVRSRALESIPWFGDDKGEVRAFLTERGHLAKTREERVSAGLSLKQLNGELPCNDIFHRMEVHKRLRADDGFQFTWN